jgi:SUMO ligase MMS21 Smc5/6 complex component
MLRNTTSTDYADVLGLLTSTEQPFSLKFTPDELKQVSNIKKFDPESYEFLADLRDLDFFLTCPVSKKSLKNPVIARCGHIFSSESVAGLDKCPVEDCSDERLVVQQVRVLNDFLTLLPPANPGESKDEDDILYLRDSYKKLDAQKISQMIEILKCPVTISVFLRPVILTKCGHSVERDVCEDILKSSNKVCPSCRKEFTKDDYLTLPVVALICYSLAKYSREVMDEQLLNVDGILTALVTKDLPLIRHLIQCYYEKPELLNEVTESRTGNKFSALLIMTMNDVGLQLFEANPLLIDIITASSLNHIESVLSDSSPLLYFAKSALGARLLHNEGLRNKIDVNTFYKVSPQLGISPCMFVMLQGGLGMLINDSRLASGMTYDRLNYCIPDSRFKGYTLLYFMAMQANVIDFFRKYPDKIKIISSEILCKPMFTVDAHRHARPSALMQIATWQSSMQFFYDYDEFRDKISPEGFTYILSSGPQKGRSLLIYFAKFTPGPKVLQKDARLRSFITEKMLSSSEADDNNQSALFYLMSYEDGLDLLNYDPSLHGKISARGINHIKKMFVGDETFNSAPVSMLFRTEQGCDLLAKYPAICEKISLDALLSVVSQIDGFPLLALTALESGVQLLKTSAVLRAKITAQALLVRHTFTTGIMTNPLTLLLRTEGGREFLILLTKENPQLCVDLKGLVLPATCENLTRIGVQFAEAEEKLKKMAEEKAQMSPQEVLAEKIRSIVARYKLPDASDANLYKAMRRAALEDNAEDIRCLVVEKGLDINAQDDNPHSLKTALHWAVIKTSYKAVKELILLEAKDDIKDFQGKTARALAKAKNDPEINSLLMLSDISAQPSIMRLALW